MGRACEDALKNPERHNITEFCGDLDNTCGGITAVSLYQTMNRAMYDISHPANDPFPPPHMYGYLREESVLAALGVPVNFTEMSMAVSMGFQNSYDPIHGGFLDSIGYLLDRGVKVHMMYGDRDYGCNWVGGERASLAVKYSRATDFANAGYSPLVTHEGIKGMTRQFGNYSFTRVFQAGHEVPSYQPVAAHDIFVRATFNKDIATGLLPVTDELSTIGPKDTWYIKNIPPDMPTPKCYILKPETCVSEIWAKVMAGVATVRDYFVVDENSEDGLQQHGDKDQEVMDEL